jgi:isopenicillin N synthase-like dioxygenase
MDPVPPYIPQSNYSMGYLQFPLSNIESVLTLTSKEWTPVRLHLLETVSQVLNANIPLRGTTLLDSVTVGIHHYDSRNLSDHSAHFNPPHMDSGTFTILFRSHHENDGLEIADLETTKRKDSEGVGAEASFIPVPTAGDGIPEVVVFAGTRLQRILGRDQVRACVHRVRGPGLVCCRRPGVQRISMAMFCAPAPRSSE